MQGTCNCLRRCLLRAPDSRAEDATPALHHGPQLCRRPAGRCATDPERVVENQPGSILGAMASDRLPLKVFTEKVKNYPRCLERAAELLGSKHYMYAALKARQYFSKATFWPIQTETLTQN